MDSNSGQSMKTDSEIETFTRKRIRQTSDESIMEEDSSAGPKELMNIADDGIFAIIRFLTLKDLCSISKTCRRLHLLAANQFRRSYPSKANGRMGVCKNEHENQIRLSPNEEYVACFSKFFQDVQISLARDYNDDTIESIRSKCSVNLRKIKFYEMTLHKSIGQLFGTSFEQIEAVQFHACDGDNECYTSILKHCPNLKQLSTIVRGGVGENGVNLLMQQKYPKLTSFHYGYTNSFEKDNFTMFLRQNPTIRSIMFEIDVNALEIVKRITDHATNLEALFLAIQIGTSDFKMIIKHLKILCDRKQFKRLELYFSNSLMESLLIQYDDELALLTKLQGIHLDLIDVATVFPVISSFTNLKILSFDYVSRNLNMSDRDLPNLEELHLNDLYQDQFRCVDTFVRHAAKLKRIFIPQCNYLNSLTIYRYQFNVMELNEKRNALPGACELMIYTDYPDNPNNFTYDLVKLTQTVFRYNTPSDIDYPFIYYTKISE